MACFRILMVDDEPSVLDVLSNAVRMQLPQTEVDTAGTAEAAFQQLKHNDYDAIVCDIHLPDMHGLQLLKEIRALCPATPTVVITGLDDQELAIQALRIGAYDYIRKPLEIEYFVASLNRAIQMRQMSRELEGHKLALERHALELEQIVGDRTRELSREIADRKQIEEALQQSNLKLTDWVQELQHRTQQITYLSEMTALLQACQSVEEASTVAAQSLKDLFADDCGSLCLYNESTQQMEVITSWGTHNASMSEFPPDMCWALRRLQPHAMGDLASTLVCQHLLPSRAVNHLCIPMIGQGKALGLLFLQSGLRPQSPRSEARRNLILAKQRLAEAVANHIALALANLHLRETLRNESVRDPVTDLYNRRYLEETLPRELIRATREQYPLSVIMIDVDNFKQFNDKFSHDAGDAMLRALAGQLKSHTRGQDIACRYGGDEFLVVLPGASMEVGCQRAERLREEVKRMEIDKTLVPLVTVSLSMGVACFPEHGSTAASLIRAADMALYSAKSQGRDQVVAQPISQKPSPESIPSR
jgi:diguanylate cyclase (GGDEF)-like protein